MPIPKVPILFTKPRTALTGPYPAAINIPKCAQDDTSDYEAELCVVIGRTGKNISEDDALDYVLGYTASNDVSARTLQMLTAQWSFSKGLDGSCPIGQFTTIPLPQTSNKRISRPCACGSIGYQRPPDFIHQSHSQWDHSSRWSHQQYDLQHPETNLLPFTGNHSRSRNDFPDWHTCRNWLFPSTKSRAQGW